MSFCGCAIGTLNVNFGDVHGSGITDLRKIEIGSWDMDLTPSVFVPSGSPDITASTIRSVEVYILNDLQTQLRRLDIVAGPANGNWVYNNGFNLLRVTGGFFDSTDYDDPNINRGYIIVGLEL